MNIRKKSSAELEHQVADYLVNCRTHPGDMRAWYLGETAQLLLDSTPEEVVNDPLIYTQNPGASREDIEQFAANYPVHLKARSKEDADRVLHTQKTAAVERYKQKFQQQVKNIDFSLKNGLKRGYSAKPYPLELSGRQYIVRVIKPFNSLQEVEKHIDSSLKVADIDHLEKVEAVSYIDGITVAPRVPGVHFDEMEATGYASCVTKDQIVDLYKAMKKGNERGIGFDGLGSNFFYDPDYGFSVIDMGFLTEATTASRALYYQLYDLVSISSNDPDYLHELSRIIVVVMNLFRNDEQAQDDLIQLETIHIQLTERAEWIDSLNSTPGGVYGIDGEHTEKDNA